MIRVNEYEQKTELVTREIDRLNNIIENKNKDLRDL